MLLLILVYYEILRNRCLEVNEFRHTKTEAFSRTLKIRLWHHEHPKIYRLYFLHQVVYLPPPSRGERQITAALDTKPLVAKTGAAYFSAAVTFTDKRHQAYC